MKEEILKLLDEKDDVLDDDLKKDMKKVLDFDDDAYGHGAWWIIIFFLFVFAGYGSSRKIEDKKEDDVDV